MKPHISCAYCPQYRGNDTFRCNSPHFAVIRNISQEGKTMNTEHQNRKPQLPELPRFIEERPVVYDDGHLEEIREIAALPPIHLSPEEIEYAISLFARGFARGDVVIGLIEEFPERRDQDTTDDTFKKDSPIDCEPVTPPVPSLRNLDTRHFTISTKNTSVRHTEILMPA